ncbi:hypothetical protein PQO03_12455 [Lentisphaera profundi]|uniref:Uncharacterized protein n=1 Tax=Lentisphaera profundi TaxID=1658616 RepID=A0ABY7VZG1_9BACT|nr:hypothetical protein [Lentisphaera profundi]WDE98648.1 hypothetical protein PQO03_12455 [Lentisphaera profundi]
MPNYSLRELAQRIFVTWKLTIIDRDNLSLIHKPLQLDWGLVDDKDILSLLEIIQRATDRGWRGIIEFRRFFVEKCELIYPPEEEIVKGAGVHIQDYFEDTEGASLNDYQLNRLLSGHENVEKLPSPVSMENSPLSEMLNHGAWSMHYSKFFQHFDNICEHIKNSLWYRSPCQYVRSADGVEHEFAKFEDFLVVAPYFRMLLKNDAVLKKAIAVHAKFADDSLRRQCIKLQWDGTTIQIEGDNYLAFWMQEYSVIDLLDTAIYGSDLFHAAPEIDKEGEIKSKKDLRGQKRDIKHRERLEEILDKYSKADFLYALYQGLRCAFDVILKIQKAITEDVQNWSELHKLVQSSYHKHEELYHHSSSEMVYLPSSADLITYKFKSGMPIKEIAKFFEIEEEYLRKYILQKMNKNGRTLSDSEEWVLLISSNFNEPFSSEILQRINFNISSNSERVLEVIVAEKGVLSLNTILEFLRPGVNELDKIEIALRKVLMAELTQLHFGLKFLRKLETVREKNIN